MKSLPSASAGGSRGQLGVERLIHPLTGVVLTSCRLAPANSRWILAHLINSSMTDSWERGDYQISTDRSRLNLELIHDFLSHNTYWATGRSLEVVQRSIENSLPFGIYHGN